MSHVDVDSVRRSPRITVEQRPSGLQVPTRSPQSGRFLAAGSLTKMRCPLHALKFECARHLVPTQCSMARYRFEVLRNGVSLGDAWVDLRNLSDMRREAFRALHDICFDEMVFSDLDEALTVSVHDDGGRLVYAATVAVSQALSSHDPAGH
ncbi:hypothetical protein CK216_21795 [Mesorhizobium sp. WSM3876]|nr:hypothetical protein CK216_21795 [Mesorhizobium sp. WSM3876]